MDQPDDLLASPPSKAGPVLMKPRPVAPTGGNGSYGSARDYGKQGEG
jgi:hypothetical protein